MKKIIIIFFSAALFLLSYDVHAQLQSDQSDAEWAIVMPVAASVDVDMGQVLVGAAKDQVIVNFVTNNGTCKFRVDAVYFIGADAGSFSLVSGIPEYDVAVGGSQFGEFRFKPVRVGIHSAQIVICTQADTLVKNIIGMGIQPQLQLMTRLIEFGKVKVGNNKDTIQVATIKNIGSASLDITYTKHNKPNDIDFTTLTGGGSFSVAVGDSHKMNLRFSPSDYGRTSGIIEFHFNGVGSPAKIQLFGIGTGNEPKIKSDFIGFPNLICQTSAQSILKITNTGLNPLDISSMNIKGSNSSDFSLLGSTSMSIEPDSSSNIVLMFNPSQLGNRTANLEIKSNADPDSIMIIPLSGKKDSVFVAVSEKIIDLSSVYQNEIQNGKFTLTNYGNLTNKLIFNASKSFTTNINSLTLNPNNSGDVVVLFSGSSVPGTIDEEISFRDTICNIEQKVRVRINVLSSPISTIKVGYGEGYPGDMISIPLILSNPTDLQAVGISGIDAELSYNSTVLVPVDYIPYLVEQSTSKIQLKNLPITSNEIANIKFRVGLGNLELSELALSQVKPIGGSYIINTLSGSFKLLGICSEGGKRLFSPSGKAEMLFINPNPAGDELNITLNTIEAGETNVIIYNLIGNEIMRLKVDTQTSGRKELNVNISDFSNGIYLIKYQTPTWFEYLKLMIRK